MVIRLKTCIRQVEITFILLWVLALVSTNESLETGVESTRNETDSDMERQYRSPSRPKSNTATLKQDTKPFKPQGNADDLQSSSTVARRAAKSPLVLKLLQEQETGDLSNQLAYSSVSPLPPGPQVLQGPIAYAAPEKGAVYYHETPEENEGRLPQYAEAEKEISKHQEIAPTKPPRYQYVYKVKDSDGNDFGHSEARTGARTWGRYFVHLPDGRQKTVKYWADNSGYHAEVEYNGHAVHPTGHKKN